jgi:hypothetical protein
MNHMTQLFYRSESNNTFSDIQLVFRWTVHGLRTVGKRRTNWISYKKRNDDNIVKEWKDDWKTEIMAGSEMFIEKWMSAASVRRCIKNNYILEQAYQMAVVGSQPWLEVACMVDFRRRTLCVICSGLRDVWHYQTLDTLRGSRQSKLRVQIVAT